MNRGYSLLNLTLTLLLAAFIVGGVLAAASALDHRRKVNQSLDLVHRAAARAKALYPMQPDGYASVTTARVADLVSPGQRVTSGGTVTALRTALSRELTIVPDGNFGFWVRLSGLPQSECRALLRQAWANYPRVRLNNAIIKVGMATPIGNTELALCTATNTLDMEGS